MTLSYRILLSFLGLSICALGIGNPLHEHIWVPLFAGLLLFLHQRNALDLPRKHLPWLLLFCLWWMALLIPIPTEWLPHWQNDLGEYRHTLHQFLGQHTTPTALFPMVHLLTGSILILLYVLYQWLHTNWQQTIVQRYLWLFSLLFLGFGLVQHGLGLSKIFGFIHVPTELRSPFFGSFINGNHAGYWLVCGLYLHHFAKLPSLWHWLGMIGYGVGLWLCDSRGAWALGLFALIWLYGPHWLMIGVVISALLGGGLLWTNDGTYLDNLSHGRWQMWIDALQLSEWSWSTGLGFGGFSEAFGLVKTTPEYIQSQHLHMEYLEWFIQTGIIGSLIFLSIVSKYTQTIFRQLSQNKWQLQTPWIGIVTTFALASCIDFPLQLNALAIIGCMALVGMQKDTQIESTFPTVPPNKTPTFILLSVFLCSTALPLFSPIYSHAKLHTSTLNQEWLSSQPLHPTALERDLWEQVRALPTDATDPLLFSSDLGTDSEIASLGEMIEVHANTYRSNIEAQRLLARWYRRMGNYNDSCRVWQRVWTLETSVLSTKNTWLTEGLACDPNLWLVVSTLPNDVDILLASAQLLIQQGNKGTTQFLLERAVELETPPWRSGLLMTQWLIQQQTFERAWTIHRSLSKPSTATPTEECAFLKNTAWLGVHFQIEKTSQVFEELLAKCGEKAHWQNQRLFSGLIEGRADITKEFEQMEDVEASLYWQHLYHAYTIQQNSLEACRWIRFGFQQGKEVNQADIQNCSRHKSPSPVSKWQLFTPSEIDKRLQP